MRKLLFFVVVSTMAVSHSHAEQVLEKTNPFKNVKFKVNLRGDLVNRDTTAADPNNQKRGTRYEWDFVRGFVKGTWKEFEYKLLLTVEKTANKTNEGIQETVLESYIGYNIHKYLKIRMGKMQTHPGHVLPFEGGRAELYHKDMGFHFTTSRVNGSPSIRFATGVALISKFKDQTFKLSLLNNNEQYKNQTGLRQGFTYFGKLFKKRLRPLLTYNVIHNPKQVDTDTKEVLSESGSNVLKTIGFSYLITKKITIAIKHSEAHFDTRTEGLDDAHGASTFYRVTYLFGSKHKFMLKREDGFLRNDDNQTTLYGGPLQKYSYTQQADVFAYEFYPEEIQNKNRYHLAVVHNYLTPDDSERQPFTDKTLYVGYRVHLEN